MNPGVIELGFTVAVVAGVGLVLVTLADRLSNNLGFGGLLPSGQQIGQTARETFAGAAQAGVDATTTFFAPQSIPEPLLRQVVADWRNYYFIIPGLGSPRNAYDWNEFTKAFKSNPVSSGIYILPSSAPSWFYEDAPVSGYNTTGGLANLRG